MHAVHLPRRAQIQPGDASMRRLSAQKVGDQSALWGDVIDITPATRQEPQILQPPLALCCAKFCHAIPQTPNTNNYAPGRICPAGGALAFRLSGGQILSDKTVTMTNSPKPLKRLLVTVE